MMTDPSDTRFKRDVSTDRPVKRRKVECDDAVGPCWADLSRPEIIGHIARCLSMNNSELRNFLSCIRPETLPVIRKMYLTGNDHYLHYVLDNHEKCYCSSSIKPKRYSSEEYEMVTCQIRCWMSYNEKAWKERCRGRLLEKNTYTTSFPLKALVRFRASRRIGGLVLNPTFAGDIREPSQFGFNSQLVSEKFYKNSGPPVLVSVGGAEIPAVPDVEHFRKLLRDPTILDNDGKAQIRVLRYLDTIFFEPVRVIEHGLVEVLRFMIEEGIISPNERCYRSIRGAIRMPLVFHAASNLYDMSCLEYLLSLDSTVINSSFLFFTIDYHDAIPISLFEKILSDSRIDVNEREEIGVADRTPFLYFIDSIRHLPVGEKHVQMIRALLESGADPNLRDSNRVSGLEMLLTDQKERRFLSSKAENGHMEQIIQMVKKSRTHA